MTITVKDYAVLCSDSYNNREKGKKIILGGVIYKVFDRYSNSFTGYQGTAYQRLDTEEVVIASRGTEKNWSDALTDAGMVVAGLNAQIVDAKGFADRVKHEVEKQSALQNRSTPSITVTGHSLGGAITEILAHEFGMHGVTFNAYGAVDMGYRIPEGGSQVTNYVRMTDVVSAASRHFGKVVELATPEDIEQLKHAGYDNNVTAQSLRNPLTALSFAAHGIDNFAPNNPGLTRSDLSPDNEARARAHGKAIGLYRADIQALRANTLSLPWELQQKQQTAVHLAGRAATAALQGDFEHAGKITELAAHRTTENARYAWNTATNTAMLGINAIDRVGEHIADQIKETAGDVNTYLDHLGKAMGSDVLERNVRHAVQDISQAVGQGRDIAHRLLSDASHPVHDLYQQARDAIHRLDAEHGHNSDQRSDNLAASLTVAAHREGINQISHVVLSEDASHAFAMDRSHSPLNRFAVVSVVDAINTPIEQSSAAWIQVAQERAQVQAREQVLQPARQQSHGLSR
ncbi:XVIPCD domain-containing protein [Dyella humi]|uniref:Lipase (Class 3) n=1 Tax=Dyella humi TaxID=1770547 RepID=A0ABW8IHU0_9GAMM